MKNKPISFLESRLKIRKTALTEQSDIVILTKHFFLQSYDHLTLENVAKCQNHAQSTELSTTQLPFDIYTLYGSTMHTKNNAFLW
jgi:hypothetical protein